MDKLVFSLLLSAMFLFPLNSSAQPMEEEEEMMEAFQNNRGPGDSRGKYSSKGKYTGKKDSTHELIAHEVTHVLQQAEGAKIPSSTRPNSYQTSGSADWPGRKGSSDSN